MKEFWTYTGLRIGLFVASAAVVWGVYALVADSINLVVVLVLAAVISSLASWRLLAGPRNRLAASVDARASRAASRFEEMRAKEDDEQGTAPAPGPTASGSEPGRDARADAQDERG